MRTAQRLLRALALAGLLLPAAGCQAVLERTNRVAFAFNDVLEMGLFGPASRFYEAAVPRVIRRGVTNFFDNLRSINVVLNDVLQGKLRQGGSDLSRFVVNSTAGVGGILDVATPLGLEQHDEDFGQTLGVWGLGPGPYIVLPLFGPSSLRDAPAIPFSILTNPITYIDKGSLEWPLWGLNALDQRTERAGALRTRDEAALDRYVFTREAYLQRREFLVRDGTPPREDADEEFGDLLEEAGEP